MSMREFVLTSIFWGFDEEKLTSVRCTLNSQLDWTRSRYNLEVLFKGSKIYETKSQKVLGSDSEVCKSYRGKISRGLRTTTFLNRVNDTEKFPLTKKLRLLKENIIFCGS